MLVRFLLFGCLSILFTSCLYEGEGDKISGFKNPELTGMRVLSYDQNYSSGVEFSGEFSFEMDEQNRPVRIDWPTNFDLMPEYLFDMYNSTGSIVRTDITYSEFGVTSVEHVRPDGQPEKSIEFEYYQGGLNKIIIDYPSSHLGSTRLEDSIYLYKNLLFVDRKNSTGEEYQLVIDTTESAFMMVNKMEIEHVSKDSLISYFEEIIGSKEQYGPNNCDAWFNLTEMQSKVSELIFLWLCDNRLNMGGYNSNSNFGRYVFHKDNYSSSGKKLFGYSLYRDTEYSQLNWLQELDVFPLESPLPMLQHIGFVQLFGDYAGSSETSLGVDYIYTYEPY